VGKVAKEAPKKFLMDLAFLCISVPILDKRKFPSPCVLASSSAGGHRPGLIKDQPSTPQSLMLPEKKGLAWPRGKDKPLLLRNGRSGVNE